MAEKTMEELVEEIAKLQKELEASEEIKKELQIQLEEEKTQSKAIDHIKNIAEQVGIDCDKTNTSVEYWLSVLTVVFLELNQKGEADLEELCAEAEFQLTKANNIIGFKDEEIASIKFQLTDLQKQLNAKDNDLNRLMKKEIELEQVKATLAEVRTSRETINKNYRELSKEKSKAEHLIVKLREEMAIMVGTTSNIYSEVEAMIADTFIEHGYKVSPHSLSDDNKKDNDRQFELYKAVQASKKADKKAKKLSTGELIYPADGYNNIEKELVEKYQTIIEKYRKVNAQLAEEFIHTFASEQAKQDGVVTNEEMVRIILEKEQSKGGFKGFVKSTSGKVLTLATAVVLAGTIFIASIFAVGKMNAQNALDDTKTNLDTTISELEDLKGEKDDLQIELDDANQQLADKNQQIEDMLNGQLQGDIVTVSVSEEEFNAYKTALKSTAGGVVRALQSCQYNKETGKVEILLNSIASNRKEITELITFSIDMSKVSANITEGKAILDFATIIDYMKSSTNFTRTSYSANAKNDLDGNTIMGSVQSGEIVKAYTSTDSSRNGNVTSVKCKVMLVKTDANGKVVDIETYDKSKTLMGQIDVASEKENLLNDFLVELGIDYQDQEAGI